MFDSLIEAVKTLHPSVRNMLMGVAVTLVVVAALVTYDLKLKEVRLSAIDRSVSLIRESQLMLQSSEPELREAATILRRQALDLLNGTNEPEPLSPYLKFAAAFAPWALFCLLGRVFGRANDWFTWFFESLRFLLWGTAFGLIGAVLPDAQLPWFNLAIYPVGHFVVFIVIVFLYSIDRISDETIVQSPDESDQD